MIVFKGEAELNPVKVETFCFVESWNFRHYLAARRKFSELLVKINDFFMRSIMIYRVFRLIKFKCQIVKLSNRKMTWKINQNSSVQKSEQNEKFSSK